jgi:hypothetical protein
MKASFKTTSEECSAIAFYGIEPSANAAEKLYHRLIMWFQELGNPPDKIAIKGLGYSGKLVPFIRGNTSLHKAGFDGIIVFELVCTSPNAQIWGRDFELTASYNADDGGLHADIIARSSVASLSPTSMLPIATAMCQILKPSYGIGYRRERSLGPELYAIGLAKGLGLTGADYEEAVHISRWCDGMDDRVWTQGLLRDVYPWNFLTAPQLARPVGRASLEKWIRQDAKHGTLLALCNGITLWEIMDADISAVRQALAQAGVIFD